MQYVYAYVLFQDASTYFLGVARHQSDQVHTCLQIIWLRRHLYMSGQIALWRWCLRHGAILEPSSFLLVNGSCFIGHLPSAKRLHKYGKSSYLMGTLTINIVIFPLMATSTTSEFQVRCAGLQPCPMPPMSIGPNESQSQPFAPFRAGIL